MAEGTPSAQETRQPRPPRLPDAILPVDGEREELEEPAPPTPTTGL
jgi:hypothetical protein